MRRPNILVVMTDTSRCDTLASYGNPDAVSPHLDRLAAEGVRFTQAHTAAPVCMPARCSLLTGLHTPIHGCVENGIARREDLTTLPDLLSTAGYHTIMVGKTHFGTVPESFAVRHVLHGEKGADVKDFYADHLRSHGYSRPSEVPNPIPPDLFCDAFLAETTIADIEAHRRRNPNQPFFALCSMPSPHSPLDPPGKWAHLFDERGVPAINYQPGEEGHWPAHLRRLIGDRGVEGSVNEGDEARDHKRRSYYGLAAYCDAQVGRLLDYVDRAGLTTSTLVIFLSDHGQQYYDHGFNDKHNFYDASWRIPLIMRYPQRVPSGSVAEFAMTQDVTATCVAAAGVEAPWLQGYDLLSSLTSPDAAARHSAVSVLHRSLALVSRRWKLVYDPEDRSGQLFDRVRDPMEQINRYADPDYRKLREALRESLLAWRADLADVEYLHAHTSRGGPVARRVAAQNARRSGLDAERRLDERIGEIEGWNWY